MRRIHFIGTLLCAALVSFGAQIRADENASALYPTEKIEWTWTDRPVKPDASLPNVLLVGDSITRAYYPEVSANLKDVANVYLFATSACAGDPRLVRQVADYFQMLGGHFAVIHFNNGMHGKDYDVTRYAAGLKEFLHTLRSEQPQAALIWATITPIREDAGADIPNARIDERNRAALEIIQSEGIPVDDQHALMLSHQRLHSDNVHFKRKGSAIQAKQVSTRIGQALHAKNIPTG